MKRLVCLLFVSCAPTGPAPGPLGAGDAAMMPPDAAGDGGVAGDATIGPVTTVRVHYDAGFGNGIEMRGEAPVLSWSSGVSLAWAVGNVWEYTTAAGSAPLELKPVLVDAVGAITWPPGSNYRIGAGGTVELFPFFSARAGRVTSLTVSSSIYGYDRAVAVYLPPSYDEPGAAAKRYPVLFMHDGQNLFGNGGPFGGWQLDPSLDSLLVTGFVGATEVGSASEMIVVAPHNSFERIYEYTPTNGSYPGCDATSEVCGGGADAYLDFLLTEVQPAIDAAHRTAAGRAGIGGSSLGGLLSLHACWTRPGAFDRCGVFSPSLWWDDEALLEQIESHAGPKPDVSIYLDAGTDNDGLPRVERLESALLADFVTGTDLWCIQGGGHGHNEAAWRVRAPWGLHFLYADPARVQLDPGLPAPLATCSP